MIMEGFINKFMHSCDSKGSILRAALRNPIDKINKFTCPSGPSPTIIFHVNLSQLGIDQQGQG